MICPACKGVEHNGQPEKCPGGTWCDCLHRGPQQMNEESETSNKLIDTESGVTNV